MSMQGTRPYAIVACGRADRAHAAEMDRKPSKRQGRACTSQGLHRACKGFAARWEAVWA